MRIVTPPHRHSDSLHKGSFFRRLPYLESTALILSGTIGAGILGIPFAFAQVGAGLGIISIFLVGFLVWGLNMLVAEIACSTRRPLQLVGLARKYLGKGGEMGMLIVMYTMLFGTLLIYLIGEGETLFALFGYTPEIWTAVFFVVASAFVLVGMKTIKTVEMFLIFCVLGILGVIMWTGIPHMQFQNLSSLQPTNIFVLYSVLLFAFHSTTAIPEAHTVLQGKNNIFKRSISTASIICIVLYALFSIAVVGVTGAQTTPIATIALGFRLGSGIHILSSLFAVFAMATGFLMGASAVRDSLKWDFHFSQVSAALVACCIPALLYFSGIRGFIVVMDIIGGVFVSLEMILMILIYWKARHQGQVASKSKFLQHAFLISTFLFVLFLSSVAYSVIQYF